MDQDFPLKLFPTIELSRENETETDIGKFIKEIYPNFDMCDSLDINYDENLNNINCLTHKFHIKDSLNARIPLQPWSLPKSLKYGIQPYDNEMKFEDVCCKSTLGKFTRERFGGGLSGKCIYVRDHNIWLTPVEFLKFSGSTRAEWKPGILFKSFNYAARRKVASIKSEISEKRLKPHNEFCSCSICGDADLMQYSNPNYLETFTCDGNLIHMYPNPENLNQLTIDSLHFGNSNLADFLSEKELKDSSIESIKYKFTDILTLDKQIKEIRRQHNFDEDFFFINIRFNSTCFKTLKINSDLNLIDIVFEKEFKKRKIKSICPSPHVKGEFAICVDNELMLQTDNVLKSVSKIGDNLMPLFESLTSTRKYLTFSSHPRNFIYSDYSRVSIIDTRLPTSQAIELFAFNQDSNELIELNKINESDFNQHLICGTRSIFIVDERFKSRSLISWKHDLKHRPNIMHIKNFNALDNIFLSDVERIYSYQFSTKKYDCPIMHNSPYRIDCLRDMCINLPNNYDKRFKRHLDYRCSKPLVATSVLNENNSFILFQMYPNCELYYQCFDISEKKEDMDIDHMSNIHSKNVTNWFDSIKSLDNVLRNEDLHHCTQETSNYHEAALVDDYVPLPSIDCQICNQNRLKNETMDVDNNLECKRCCLETTYISKLLSRQNLNSLNESYNQEEIFDAKQVKLSGDKSDLTNKLFKLWENDDIEEEEEEMDE